MSRLMFTYSGKLRLNVSVELGDIMPVNHGNVFFFENHEADRNKIMMGWDFLKYFFMFSIILESTTSVTNTAHMILSVIPPNTHKSSSLTILFSNRLIILSGAKEIGQRLPFLGAIKLPLISICQGH